jgi:23S rRNA (guanosine2251-2'-O)-methyltransferase
VRHQGVAAVVSAADYADADAVCAAAIADPAGLLVLVDGVEDPRNLGAIVRTAAAAGASAVVLGAGGSVGLTSAVAKTSAGALERIPVAREPKLRRRILGLRALGMRVWALHAGGSLPWDRFPEAEGRTALLVGGEGAGVRRGLLDACDGAVAIPLAAGVESLNVSVAVGVVLFETLRRRRASGRERP